MAGAGSQGILQGKVYSVRQVKGEHRFGICLHGAGWVGGALNKGTVVLASAPIPRDGCPDHRPSSPPREDSQFSLSCVPGAFRAAALLLELRVRDFVCRPFKNSPTQCPAALCPSVHTISLVFTDVMGTFLLITGVLGWGAYCVPGTLSSS